MILLILVHHLCQGTLSIMYRCISLDLKAKKEQDLLFMPKNKPLHYSSNIVTFVYLIKPRSCCCCCFLLIYKQAWYLCACVFLCKTRLLSWDSVFSVNLIDCEGIPA
ncbi:uncharacterized protein B0P05DRAFT_631417 [Gilbertella persicaria]|uniref:uncharacterized protein n=1 Tax=Gilbertella persicaria TaxID=101096 RepID=UPI002220FD5E|nr:uncharacterized protein B0P05DRAFT_631417 [Gilbertella persicaria]KAI8088084.1 hypothetical protein B0P05DRAFT_631417 [Gilbertella persicaria]